MLLSSSLAAAALPPTLKGRNRAEGVHIVRRYGVLHHDPSPRLCMSIQGSTSCSLCVRDAALDCYPCQGRGRVLARVVAARRGPPPRAACAAATWARRRRHRRRRSRPHPWRSKLGVALEEASAGRCSGVSFPPRVVVKSPSSFFERSATDALSVQPSGPRDSKRHC